MSYRPLIRIAAAGVLATLAAGAGAAQLVVGQVAPLSGLDASQGRGYSAGIQLALGQANRAGGVNGNTFALVRKDDSGRAAQTLAATQELLSESRPIVLAGFFGNQAVESVVDAGVLLKEHIALVGYHTSEIRPDAPLLYNVRAGLRDEIGKITEHLATVGITRVGLFHEDGPGAAALVKAAEEAAARSRATLVAKSAYAAGSVKVLPAVGSLGAATPQAIILVSSGAAAAAFIEQYRSAGGTAQLFATSGTDVEQLSKRLAEEHMRGVAIAQVTPSPYKITGRLAKEFADAVATTPPEVPVGFAMMEGYIAGKVIVEAVRRAGARATREGVASALESLDGYDLGGYQISYRNGHAGSRFVEMSIVSGTGRILQ